MDEKRFNLIDEHWILVSTEDDKIEEISLKEALNHPEKYKGLAGELPAQDAAVFRLLEAIVHTAVTRYDLEGNESPLKDSKEALKRWQQIWKMGSLPEKAINAYLEMEYEKFWLIHPEFPFYQAKMAEIGSPFEAGKLMGDLSESNNKPRLFQNRWGEEKQEISFPEAARWLLYTNGYDDNASKAKQKERNGEKLPTPGVGWLGKIGQIYAAGDNLFETMMLNLVLIDENGLMKDDHPYWEIKATPLERNLIQVPDNLAELWTIPSRRILLRTKGDKVTGYTLLGGDFFVRERADIEQNTVWRLVEAKKKTDLPYFTPKRHSSSRQAWRDFSLIVGSSETEKKTRQPGVIRWISTLKRNRLIPRDKAILFQMPFVEYGDKDFFVTDTSEQTMILYPALFTETGTKWVEIIKSEIGKIDELAKSTGQFARTISEAAGNDPESSGGIFNEGQSKAYSYLSTPFLTWLASINPESEEDPQQVLDRWHLQARNAAYRLDREYMRNLSVKALLGKTIQVTDKKGITQSYIVSAPKAQAIYRSKINKLYGKQEKAHE